MKKKPTYEELQEQVIRLKERIAYLERMLYGSKSDRVPKSAAVDDSQPGLFDEFFKEALDEKTALIEETAKEIEAETKKRRERARKKPSRPSKYRYSGLEERTTVIMPDGLDASECDVIGKDVTRILHREPAKVWVEVVERPILRKKADKDKPCPHIYQARAPRAVIGGNHIGADILAQIIIDKYRYHLPEYRQVKQYADLGVRLPASTLNDWVHAAASKLDPLYEALRKDIRH
ncbi:transposase, partial [Salmonella enterica]|nr:transposase [Salmonella enterica]